MAVGFVGRVRRAVRYLFTGASASSQASNQSFDESCLLSDPLDEREWDDWLNRGQRQRLYWACYEGSQYSPAHGWSYAFRKAFALYAHTRTVLSPGHCLGEFGARHIMGGRLDKKAGDGTTVPSALPILAENPAIPEALSVLWKHSNWAAKKTVWCRYGTVMGDAVLVARDDLRRRRVTMEVWRPHVLKWIDRDAVGNIRGYMREEERPDPRWIDPGDGSVPNAVTYSEVCERVGRQVRYTTFLGGEEFDWRVYEAGDPQVGPQWTVPYDFVPMVIAQHIDVGFNWGWCEYHALLSRMREVDDLGCVTTDQARRVLNGLYMVNTRRPSDATDNKTRPTPDEYSSQNQSLVDPRDSMKIKWVDKENLKVIPMIGDMDFGQVDGHTKLILDMMARDFPELLIDSPNIMSDTSGRARRYIKESAEAKIFERRAGYDDALVRLQQMCFSIGGIRRYEGYEPFDSGSYDRGDLDHEIGKRPVFFNSPFDDIELEQARANAALTWVNAGFPIDEACRRVGVAPDDIARIKSAVQAQTADEARRQKQLALAAGRSPGGNPKKAKGSPLTPPKILENKGQPSLNGSAQ